MYLAMYVASAVAGVLHIILGIASGKSLNTLPFIFIWLAVFGLTGLYIEVM